MPSVGTPSSKSPGSTCGAPSAYTEAGPPERISAAGLRARTSLGGDRVRDELRVDARLAHAPRDQLRVLAAEVDDEHRPLLRRGVAAGSGTTSALSRAVVRRLLRDRDVVRMALAQPGAGDADEPVASFISSIVAAPQ